MDGPSKGDSATWYWEHGGRSRAGGHVVLQSTERGSRLHSKKMQKLHKVEMVVEQRHPDMMIYTSAIGEKVWSIFRGSSPSETRAAEINWKSHCWLCSDQFHNQWRAELRGAAKWLYPRANSTMESLIDRQGKQANTATDKEEMLTLEFFPLYDDD